MTAARAPIAIFVVVAIWAVVLTLARAHPTAGAIDAVGTASLAMYVIAVRGGYLPRRALAITFAIGLVLARFLVADVVFLAIGLEVLALVLVAIRIRRARRAWRETRDFVAAVRATGLPAFVALELTILGYAIAGWRRPREDRTGTVRMFTTTNGWSLYAGVFAFLVVVETPVAHIALHAWPTAAWIATALSLYSVVWLIGDAHALRHGGVIVDARGLTLRLGVRWRGHIAWDDIASIERSGFAGPRSIAERCGVSIEAGSEGELNAGIFYSNIVVRLRTPQTLQGPLGRARTGASIALSLDDPDAFMRRVSSIGRTCSGHQ